MGGRGVRAPKDVKKRYEQVMGGASQEASASQEAEAEPPEESGRSRKPLDDDDCPICYEAMSEQEENRGLVTFCSCCGSNLHKDCMERWQKASKKSECPFCRQPYRRPSAQVSPGSAIPVAAKPAPRVLSRCGSGSTGYLNLLSGADDDD